MNRRHGREPFALSQTFRDDLKIMALGLFYGALFWFGMTGQVGGWS